MTEYILYLLQDYELHLNSIKEIFEKKLPIFHYFTINSWKIVHDFLIQVLILKRL